MSQLIRLKSALALQILVAPRCSLGQMAVVHDLKAVGDYYVPLEHVCDGYQEQWDNCPDLEKCGPCEPKDCILGSWSQWQLQGGCTGLKLRHREVEVQHNHCGQPCKGYLTETDKYEQDEHCKPKGKDCKFGAWGQWTVCQHKKDQSMRKRGIAQQPEEGGADCKGALEETRPCGGPADTDCHVGDWHEWTSCSAVCGKGRHTRMRYVNAEAHHGGKTCNLDLLETAECEITHCEASSDCELTQWSEWTQCDEMYVQTYRRREVIKEPEGKGKLCNASLKETLGCTPLEASDCELSDWRSWSACTASCNGGQRFRDRNVLKPPRRGGTCPKVQLRETNGCGTASCSSTGPQDCELGEWAAWSDCSSSCGEGSRVRSRKVAQLAIDGGQPCEGSLQEVKVCKVQDCQVIDCRWSDWERWSTCSVTCGGGTKTRSRNIAVSPVGGAPCVPHHKVEVAPCGEENCGGACQHGEWGQWREWTDCSSTCGDAYRFRRRNIAVHANYCGNATVGLREEMEKCEDLPSCTQDVDCQTSEWAEWTACSCDCFGMRSRSRYISRFPSGSGAVCFNETLKEIEPCNPGPRELRPADCSNIRQLDCKLNEWEDWSHCTVSCGGGQRNRVRTVKQSAMGGGIPCVDALLETSGCNTQHCAAHRCQDCVWGPWSVWGQCPTCGGQKYRHRTIDIMPNYCGKRCDLQSSKEVSDCPASPLCSERLFCAWNEWSTPRCDGTCGETAVMITRTLGLHRNRPVDGAMFEVNSSMKCAGAQVNQTECPYTHPCQDCIPIPCTFSPWSDWQQPTCEGLCTRSRVVQNVNNKCGEPCNGPLEATKRCAADCLSPRDCKMTEWSSWSACSDPGQANGQKYRERSIIHGPRNDGQPCLGALEDTMGCKQTLPQPCVFSEWEDWTACTASCGDGWTSRSRQIQSHAHRGGETCHGNMREMKCKGTGAACEAGGAVDCLLGDWGVWSTCDVNKMMYRDKRVLRAAANQGQPCAGETTQGQSCGLAPVDCRMSSWTGWGPCDRSCGEGQTRRQRQIEVFAQFGGQECLPELIETRGCMQKACPTWDAEVSDWTQWSSCSFTCGPGQQKRERQILKERSSGGRGFEGFLGEARPCHGAQECPRQDCVWNQWEEWTPCSCSCGGGQQERKRFVLHMPESGGDRCEPSDKIEMRACNTQSCGHSCQDGLWGPWGYWSECSATCDGGTTYRTRHIVQNASDCGCPAHGRAHETGICNFKSCSESRDCVVSPWTEWGSCSSSCNGIMKRERNVESYGKGSGLWCEGALKQVEACNPKPGEVPSEACEGGDPVDCVQSDWTPWSMCSVTCGGGEHLRTRKILRHPKYGGKCCDGALAELKECARHACGGPAPIDRKYSSWNHWGDCDKCNGERSRVRNIDNFPSNGGEECDPKATMEIGKCPRRCGGQKFCEWTVWGTWSDCTVTCGKGGKRRRRRHLELTEQARNELPDYVSNVAKKFETLRAHAQELQSHQMSEMVASFVAGCSFVTIILLGLRAWPRRNNQPRVAELAYRPIEEA